MVFFKKKRYTSNSQNPNLGLCSFIVCLCVIIMNIGFSAFSTNLSIEGLSANIRVHKDIRINSITIKEASQGVSLSYNEYNVKNTSTGVTLPNSNSYIILDVGIINLGNVEMSIESINGLNEGLKYEIVNNDYLSDGYNKYSLKDKLCDDKEIDRCKLGTETHILIKISYESEKAYNNAETKTFNISLNYDFDIAKYKIIFNKNNNNAVGEMESISVGYEEEIHLPKNLYSLNDCYFAGWALNPEATRILYSDMSKVKGLASSNNNEITLYAIWGQYVYVSTAEELQNAIDNFDGSKIITIAFANDIYTQDSIIINNKDDLKIDLNGFTLSSDAAMPTGTSRESDNENNGVIHIKGNSNLTIKNGKIEIIRNKVITNIVYGYCPIKTSPNSNVNLNIENIETKGENPVVMSGIGETIIKNSNFVGTYYGTLKLSMTSKCKLSIYDSNIYYDTTLYNGNYCISIRSKSSEVNLYESKVIAEGGTATPKKAVIGSEEKSIVNVYGDSSSIQGGNALFAKNVTPKIYGGYYKTNVSSYVQSGYSVVDNTSTTGYYNVVKSN